MPLPPLGQGFWLDFEVCRNLLFGAGFGVAVTFFLRFLSAVPDQSVEEDRLNVFLLPPSFTRRRRKEVLL